MKEQSCQERAVIMTGLTWEGKKLSRKSGYYDRFDVRRRKAVKKERLF